MGWGDDSGADADIPPAPQNRKVFSQVLRSFAVAHLGCIGLRTLVCIGEEFQKDRFGRLCFRRGALFSRVCAPWIAFAQLGQCLRTLVARRGSVQWTLQSVIPVNATRKSDSADSVFGAVRCSVAFAHLGLCLLVCHSQVFAHLPRQPIFQRRRQQRRRVSRKTFGQRS